MKMKKSIFTMALSLALLLTNAVFMLPASAECTVILSKTKAAVITASQLEQNGSLAVNGSVNFEVEVPEGAASTYSVLGENTSETDKLTISVRNADTNEEVYSETYDQTNNSKYVIYRFGQYAPQKDTGLIELDEGRYTFTVKNDNTSATGIKWIEIRNAILPLNSEELTAFHIEDASYINSAVYHFDQQLQWNPVVISNFPVNVGESDTFRPIHLRANTENKYKIYADKAGWYKVGMMVRSGEVSAVISANDSSAELIQSECDNTTIYGEKYFASEHSLKLNAGLNEVTLRGVNEGLINGFTLEYKRPALEICVPMSELTTDGSSSVKLSSQASVSFDVTITDDTASDYYMWINGEGAAGHTKVSVEKNGAPANVIKTDSTSDGSGAFTAGTLSSEISTYHSSSYTDYRISGSTSNNRGGRNIHGNGVMSLDSGTYTITLTNTGSDEHTINSITLRSTILTADASAITAFHMNDMAYVGVSANHYDMTLHAYNHYAVINKTLDVAEGGNTFYGPHVEKDNSWSIFEIKAEKTGLYKVGMLFNNNKDEHNDGGLTLTTNGTSATVKVNGTTPKNEAVRFNAQNDAAFYESNETIRLVKGTNYVLVKSLSSWGYAGFTLEYSGVASDYYQATLNGKSAETVIGAKDIDDSIASHSVGIEVPANGSVKFAVDVTDETAGKYYMLVKFATTSLKVTAEKLGATNEDDSKIFTTGSSYDKTTKEFVEGTKTNELANTFGSHTWHRVNACNGNVTKAADGVMDLTAGVYEFTLTNTSDSAVRFCGAKLRTVELAVDDTELTAFDLTDGFYNGIARDHYNMVIDGYHAQSIYASTGVVAGGSHTWGDNFQNNDGIWAPYVRTNYYSVMKINATEAGQYKVGILSINNTAEKSLTVYANGSSATVTSRDKTADDAFNVYGIKTAAHYTSESCIRLKKGVNYVAVTTTEEGHYPGFTLQYSNDNFDENGAIYNVTESEESNFTGFVAGETYRAYVELNESIEDLTYVLGIYENTENGNKLVKCYIDKNSNGSFTYTFDDFTPEEGKTYIAKVIVMDKNFAPVRKAFSLVK